MDAHAASSTTVRVRHDDARTFVKAILQGHGVSETNAAIIACALVQADLRGVDSHGINRMPSYMARVRNGVLDPRAVPTIMRVTPVVAQVSRHRCPAPVPGLGGWQYIPDPPRD
jgi:LDH2 family malate/lactate/ureidoglycolate dehydrogenase